MLAWRPALDLEKGWIGHSGWTNNTDIGDNGNDLSGVHNLCNLGQC